MLTMPSITSRRETWSIFSVILPLSILDISSTSLISPSKCLLDMVIFFRQFWTCCLLSRLAVAMAVMPTMAFMGVRMSWLMLDKNSLFALLALSASRWARTSARICCLVIWKYFTNTASSTTITRAQAPSSTAVQRVVVPVTIRSRAL